MSSRLASSSSTSLLFPKIKQACENASMHMIRRVSSAAHPSTLFHPIWTVAVRRFSTRQQAQALLQHQLSTTRLQQFVKRSHKNASRLYARRLLELAAASAASQRYLAHLEAASEIERPSDWDNWERKDWTDELMQSLGTSRLQRAASAISRLVSLSCLAAPMAILYPLSLWSETALDWSWRYALWAIEQAGPSFLKLTQWATTRQDLFSPEFCQYFGKLRDDTIGHSWKETKAILAKDLGMTIADDYLELEREPIGSGCIAQVYRGKLKQATSQYPAGTEVAVKVQHPGIWKKVCVDFYIMNKVALFLESLPYLNLTYLSVVDTVRQFRDIMLPQLDLTLEANHLQRFNRDFASDDRVSFPVPIQGLTTQRVLTETFMRGTPIMEYTKRDFATRKDLANLGLQTTLKMIFYNDFLHGDLHPGNILVSEENGQTQLHLLDCGLVVEVGPEQHVNMIKILGAFLRRQGRMAGQLMVDTSSKVQAGDADIELFVSGIQQIVVEDEDNNFIEKVGDYIADICFLACKHKVKLEASFINAALAVEIMEGIATALNPNIVVTTYAMPMIIQAEMMHRLPKFSLW